MSLWRRNEIYIAVVAIVGVIGVLDYFFAGPLTSIKNTLGNWSIMIAAAAMGLGFINILISNGMKIKRTDDIKEKLYSSWTIIVMCITFVLGTVGLRYPPFVWIFDNLYTGLAATFFSFAFLYMCSAAVRAFRFRNIQSSLLLVAAIIVLLGQMPVIRLTTNVFFNSRDWLLFAPSRAAYTAFRISLGLGFVQIGIRSMTGLERNWLGRLEAE